MHCEFLFLLLFCMILNSLTTQKSKASDINLLQTYWEYFSFQHYASRSGSVKICKLLLDKGADVNAQTRSGKVTSLHRAGILWTHHSCPMPCQTWGPTQGYVTVMDRFHCTRYLMT